MNKKGAIPALAWVVIIFVGILLADKVGLFEIFTYNPVTPPEAMQNYNNKFWYDPGMPAALSGTNWECTTREDVYFRTNATMITNIGGKPTNYIGSWIAVDVNGDGIMEKFGYDSTVSDIAVNLCGVGKLSFVTPDSYSIYYLSSTNTLRIMSDTCHYYVKFVSTNNLALLANNQLQSISSYRLAGQELSTGMKIIQDGGKLTCENGDVVVKYCVYQGTTPFPSVLKDDCSANPLLPCYISRETIGGVSYDGARCTGNYKPNLNICSADTKSLHKTDSAGALTTALCGVNNYNVCFNGACEVCKEGTSWCDGMYVKTCTNQVIGTNPACSGTGVFCKPTGIAPSTTAECSTTITVGTKICNGLQPQIYQELIPGVSWGYVNNGLPCLTSCSAGACVNECTVGQNKCEVGTLYKCNVRTDGTGNAWVPYNGLVSNSMCTLGCTDDAKECKSNAVVGQEYCVASTKQRQIGVATTNPLEGFAVKQDINVDPCNVECYIEGTKSFCRKLEPCVGNAGEIVCADALHIGTCNLVEDAFVPPAELCSVKLSNPEATCKDAKCIIPPPECSGEYGCAEDGLMHACSANGYFTSTIVENCANLGCEVIGVSLASPSTSQCNDACNSSSLLTCSKGALYSCETRTGVKDMNGIQYIPKSDSQLCLSTKCYPETGPSSQCAPIMAEGVYCEGKALMQAYKNTSNLIGGLVSIKVLDDNCPAGCSITGTNTYCDDLKIEMQENQDGTSKLPLTIKGKLTGSQSGNGVSTGYKATLTGAGGVKDYQSGSSNVDGTLSIVFGAKNLGTYTVVVEFPDFGETRIINVEVTNSYTISFEDLTTQLVPGMENGIDILATNANNLAPEDVVVTYTDSNITATTVKSDRGVGYWTIVFDDPQPGKYLIGVSAVENGKTLKEYRETIELVYPSIKVETNMPSSIPKGLHTYDIYIKAPTDKGISEGVTPDSITASISGTSITLKPVATIGTYTFTYDFNTAQSYELDVEVVKAGYSFSKTINSLPLTTYVGGDVPKNETVSCGDGKCTGAENKMNCPEDCEDQPNYLWYIIGAAVAIGLVLILTRKGGKRK